MADFCTLLRGSFDVGEMEISDVMYNNSEGRADTSTSILARRAHIIA